jgi:hypothetical protein
VSNEDIFAQKSEYLASFCLNLVDEFVPAIR